MEGSESVILLVVKCLHQATGDRWNSKFICAQTNGIIELETVNWYVFCCYFKLLLLQQRVQCLCCFESQWISA